MDIISMTQQALIAADWAVYNHWDTLEPFFNAASDHVNLDNVGA